MNAVQLAQSTNSRPLKCVATDWGDTKTLAWQDKENYPVSIALNYFSNQPQSIRSFTPAGKPQHRPDSIHGVPLPVNKFEPGSTPSIGPARPTI